MTAAEPPSSTSLSLLERAKAGNDAAWTKIVQLYTCEVYDRFRRRGLQEADAKDVAQQVFAAVFRGLKGFRRERPKGTFRGWLRTITRNKLHDHFRAVRRYPGRFGNGEALDQLADKDDVDNASANGRLAARLVEMLRPHFKPEAWRMFEAAMAENCSVSEIAKEFGVSCAAVYKNRSRVLRRIRQEFGDLLDDEGQDFSDCS